MKYTLHFRTESHIEIEADTRIEAIEIGAHKVHEGDDTVDAILLRAVEEEV